MNTLPNKFRPQDYGTRLVIRERLRGAKSCNYNWQSRVEWFPAGYRINKKTISKQFSRLHYLACHAPEPITKKWTKAYKVFYKKHFGADKGASMSYLNTWSCHSWL